MKKKVIIPIIVAILILAIGTIGFIYWNNRIVTTIILDINPSIEINLDKNENVKSIIALNDDAKDIINNNVEGKSLDYTFEVLITNLVEKGYVDDDKNLEVILHVDGERTNKSVSEQMEFIFGKKEVHTDVVIIEKITKEDKELAKKYNVSPAKISYVKSIVQDNDNISFDTIINDSVSELEITKETGNYCDEGYILDGDWCYKEIGRKSASDGEICPRNYKEHDGKCYEVIDATEGNNYKCNESFTLVDNKCINENTYDATGKCENGTYGQGYCNEKEYYGDAKEYCRITPETDLLYNGRCLGRKPTINGGCINGDKLINGYCYDTSASSGYKADWVCPDGAFITNPDGSLMYEDKKCYHETKVEPKSYYCEGEGVLDGKKCYIKKVEEPIKEKSCPSGYTSIEDGSRCLNLNKSVNKESSLVCEGENERLSGNECIIYERVQAKN